MPPAQRRIARSQQNQVAVQHSLAVDLAAGHHVRGPVQRLHRQQGEDRGGRRQLGVRGRRKQPPLVQSIERLPIQLGHADAELRMAQRRLGQNRTDAIRQRSLRRSGVRRRPRHGPCIALRRGLRKQPCGRNQNHRQYKQPNSP